MARLIWCPITSRMFCLSILEIKKTPGRFKVGDWSLVLEEFNMRINEYNERMAREETSGGSTNTSDAEAVAGRRLPRSTQGSVKGFFSVVRRSIVELRTCRPSTPHLSKDAELQWIADWRKSSHSTLKNCFVSSETLVECWDILKDAPQIAEISPPASVQARSSSQPPPHRLHTVSSNQAQISTVARSQCNDQSSSQDDQDSNDDDSDDSDYWDESESEDASIHAVTPPRTGGESVSASIGSIRTDDTKDTIDRHSRDNQPNRNRKHPRCGRTIVSIRRKKRRHCDQPAIAETHRICNTSDSCSQIDGVDGNNGGALFNNVEAAGAGRASPRRRSRRGSRSNISRSTRKTPHLRSPPPLVSEGTKTMKLLQRKIQVAELEHAYSKMQLKKLKLELEIEKKKQELNRVRGDRSFLEWD